MEIRLNTFEINLQFTNRKISCELFDCTEAIPVGGVLLRCKGFKDISGNELCSGYMKLLRHPAKRILKSLNAKTTIVDSFPPEAKWKDSGAFQLDSRIGIWSEKRNWSMVEYSREGELSRSICTLEEMKNLESTILQTWETSVLKMEIWSMILMNKDLKRALNFSEIGIRNLFVQVVNTYFEKPEIENLVKRYL